MSQDRLARRSFLVSSLAVAAGSLLVGCDSGPDKEITVTKQEDPMQKAKESMDFYKNNNLKKKTGANK
jgi:hypothetical protein